MLRLEGITKRFGNVTAVDRLTLEIEDEEIFVLLGPTGAGKTTTLRIVAGLEVPDEGSVVFNGKDITSQTPAERDVAFVFESHNLYPIYTVFENIAFPLRSPLHKLSKKDIKKRVKKVAEDLHISHLLDRKVTTLSGGEMQRVALGRALVRQPKLYLLDEPLSSLDLKLREELRVEFREIQKRYHTTTLYATHDHLSAMSMADRIGVLNKGKIQQIGTPQEIYHNPRNLFVASMLGSPAINVIECKMRKDGKFVVGGKQKDLEIPLHFSHQEKDKILKGKEEKDLILGVRPEYLRIYTSPKKDTLKLTIAGVEFQGSEAVVDITLGEKIIKGIASMDFEGSFGEECWVSFIKEKVYLFDRETEERIIY